MLLRLRRWCVDAAIRFVGGDRRVRAPLGAVLQKARRGAEGAGVLFLGEDRLLEGQGSSQLRQGKEVYEGQL